MPDAFDPYLHWLGIRDAERPPNHYLLLGVTLFESDGDVLMNAADRQMSHIRTFQTGKHSVESQRLLNELSTAKICLLNPERKAAYDAQLRAAIASKRAAALPVAAPLSPPVSKKDKLETFAPLDTFARNQGTFTPLHTPTRPQETFAPSDASTKNTKTFAPSDASAKNTKTFAPSDASAKNTETFAPLPPKPASASVPTVHIETSDPLDDLLPNVSLPTAPRSSSATVRTLRNAVILLVIAAFFAIFIFEGVKAYKRRCEEQTALAAAQQPPAEPTVSAPAAPAPPSAPDGKKPPEQKTETKPQPPAIVEQPKQPETAPPVENPPKQPETAPVVENPPKQPEIASETPKPAVPDEKKPEPPEDLRLEVPDPRAQAAALREIRSLFSAKYKNIKEREQKLDLARTLMQQAAESRDNPVARFALYCEARDLAATVGDAAMLTDIFKTVCREYKIDEQAMIADTLLKAAKKPRDAAGNQALAKMALELAESALRKEDDELANRLAEVGREMARKSRDSATIKQMIALLRGVDERKRLRTAFSEVERQVAENPDDPHVNQIAGQYYCLVKNDWTRGLAMLLKCNDEQLRTVIREEQLRAYASPADMAAIGELWRDVQKTVKEPNRYLVRARATYWYRRALPDAAGVTKTKVEMRLAELAE